MRCSYWPMKVSSSSCQPLLLMCGYRYISELEQSDPAFHSPVQYWFVQHLCEFSSCTSYESICWFLLDKFCHKASTNWPTCWQTPVQHTTSVNVPFPSNALCQVCLIQISWLKLYLLQLHWMKVKTVFCKDSLVYCTCRLTCSFFTLLFQTFMSVNQDIIMIMYL